MIQELRQQGVYQGEIAERLGVHRKTVGRALKRGGPPSKTRRRERYAKLKPFMGTVDKLLQAGVFNAVVIYREIQALGYDGKLRILRSYIEPRRALQPSRATLRFETDPGRQLQHDWGELIVPIGGKAQRVYIAVSVLGYSRRFHVMAAPSCDAEHTYESLARAFAWFGGVTQQVWVDNHKAAVTAHVPGAVRFNERFKQLARHYGFVPKACRPYRPRTKGKVERIVGYAKQHFFQRYRSFESFAHLNQLLEAWLLEEADKRLHGTVKEVVAVRFERERPALMPLPVHLFDTSYIETRQVGWDAYVNVRGNRYSVPSTYCGQTVTIHVSLEGDLAVYAGEHCIARHRLVPSEAGWQTVADHHVRLWADVTVEARSLHTYEEVAHASAG
ncbi:MAG: IS21 family transposase [Candidatus Tectomicrobia bacterium]|nr:IS21 family transposase [Candidatus Tectomicrobia bacterium]